MATTTTLIVLAIFSTASFASVIEPKIDPALNWRIVGGSDATPGQFPWQVSIRRASTDGHNCGAAHCNSKWILTAAHCVVNTSPSTWYIVAGTLTLSSGGNQHQIARIISHADYNSAQIKNDVAVLELEEELEFSATVQPIELESEVVGEVDCLVSGWGRLEAWGALPDNLQFIPLKTISLEACQSSWSSLVQADEICTLTQQGEGVCNGDSGSPLIAGGKQIGIVSWGNPCANGRPDVFTRVSSFLDWIEAAISSSNGRPDVFTRVSSFLDWIEAAISS
ncbi:Trypsin [Popillia japonica]|uniref:Trypsin n=1 Tax=Popillia japonica TaxID=7064 RepID=A0AAW1MNM6_POPJA